MKVNWNYVKGLLIIALVMFLFGFSNQRNLHQNVNVVDVKFEEGDNLFMDYEMVNKLLIQNSKPVKNQAKSLIDLNGLEKQVLSHPMVESVFIFLTVDGQLKTKVKQRKPIGRIKTKFDSYYIDRLGKKMPLSKNYSARVPIITGVIDENKMDDMYQLLLSIKKDEFLKKQIVGIHSNEKNEFDLITRIGDQKIHIGTIENLSTKFKNLKAFYNYTMGNKTIDNYSEISLQYNNQVVCTKKVNNGA
ncbi:MAG: cell division protein FtsQ [Urechidicola sp.]|jgi:cell division protein FtsQ